jgi:hypothetical protein
VCGCVVIKPGLKDCQMQSDDHQSSFIMCLFYCRVFPLINYTGKCEIDRQVLSPLCTKSIDDMNLTLYNILLLIE